MLFSAKLTAGMQEGKCEQPHLLYTVTSTGTASLAGISNVLFKSIQSLSWITWTPLQKRAQKWFKLKYEHTDENADENDLDQWFHHL